MRRPALTALLLVLASLPALGQAHPFGGNVLDLNAEVQLVRTKGTEAGARAFLQILYQDPFLKQLGPRMGLERFVVELAEGKPFDAAAFRAAAQRAVEAGGVQATGEAKDYVGKAEWLQKFEALEMAFSAPKGARSLGLPTENLSSHRLAQLMGPKDTRVLSMQPVPGARVLQVSETVELPGGGTRAEVALELYGRMLGEGPGSGLAHREVGRAVLGPHTQHPNGATTSDVLKGVGPTPFANNQFNSKATGSFPLPEAVRDWQKTETLRRAGVAVYEPVAIVGLPYMEWSKSEGWRPLAVFVRRARENLRVSDLEHLSRAQKRTLVAELKGKIEAELTQAGRAQTLTDVDVIKTFVERMGRTAGIFQGGIGNGQYFFHGMLHNQNVSLLGEIPDVGNSEGVERSREAMQRNWAKSNYAWWPDRLKEYTWLKGSSVETALFYRLSYLVNQHLGQVTGGGLSEAQLKELFGKAYREGRRGVSAADPTKTLTVTIERAKPTEQEKRLERFRRADRTVNWRRVRHEGVALGSFTLALFLKELAVVASTGDRVRVEEFFDYVLTTDFYKHYGLFVGGARVAEVAYMRTLQTRLKPGFVNGVLKHSLVLGAGLALPMLVEGNLSGKTFAISLTSLGLSSAAVKGGASGLRWVVELSSPRAKSALARMGASTSRLAKLGGFLYTAAELAVVLYVAEKAEHWAHAELDLDAARAQLADAGQSFFAAAAAADSPAAFEAALDGYHDAWTAYRDHLYAPLHQDEALLAERLKRPAEAAKEAADTRAEVLERIAQRPELRARVVRDHGSLEAYAEHLVAEDEAELAAETQRYFTSYTHDRERHLREIYREHRRDAPLLDGVDDLSWLLTGADPDADADPYGGRGDVFARMGRWTTRRGLRGALKDASRNRPQAYEDELEVLDALATVYAGRPTFLDVIAERRASVRELMQKDSGIFVPQRGVVDELRGVGAR